MVAKLALPGFYEASDEASITSTLTVERINSKMNPECGASHRKRSKKTVNFDLSLNKEHENKEVCKDECKDLWYRGSELKAFKEATFVMARHIAQAEERNNAPFSYKRIVERTYEVCCNTKQETNAYLLDTLERRHLQRWMDVAVSRVGIERWAVRPLGKDRLIRRSELVDIVMELQLIDSPLASDKEEFIRETCQRITRPSRLFARTMAEAQAVAGYKDRCVVEC